MLNEILSNDTYQLVIKYCEINNVKSWLEIKDQIKSSLGQVMFKEIKRKQLILEV